MKKVIYDKVFVLDIEEIDNPKMDSMLMCGSNNWDFYFADNIDDDSCLDVLENVVCCKFDTKKEFDNYMQNEDIIDYSLEHTKPMVLAYV